MEAKTYHAFWRGAAVLTAASLITKVFSALYRIPYQNIAGDEAFYTYQQVYPLYGLCLTIAVYGFPAIISKLIVEEQNPARRNEIVFVSFWFLMLLCFLTCIAVFFGASAIAQLMGDKQLTPIIQVAAGCFLFLPFLSTVRGYFQGMHNMLPTAISQVIEQLIRVTLIIWLSFYLVAQRSDAYTIGAGAMLGSLVGGAASVLLLSLFLRQQSKGLLIRSWREVSDKRSILMPLFWQGLTICVSQLSFVFMQLVDSLTFYKLLRATGEAAVHVKQIKGVYDRGIPLVQLGTVVATTFSLALLPMIVRAKKDRDMERARTHIQLALKATTILGLGASIGLACIIGPTNEMLFENRAGSNLLAILAFSILFGALAATTATMLQGLGYTSFPAASTLLGAMMKYGGNLILIPILGAAGAAYATVLALCIICSLNVWWMKRAMSASMYERGAVHRLLLACLSMILVVQAYIWFIEPLVLPGRAFAAIEALGGVVLGGSVYLVAIGKLQLLQKEELQSLLHQKRTKKESQIRKEKGA